MRAVGLKSAAIVAALLTGAWQAEPAKPAQVCADCVRAHVEHLASPELNGRRCGSADELAAARYLEGELKRLGVSGALAGGAYAQPVGLSKPRLAGTPTLQIAGGAVWTNGQDFVITRDPRPVSGRLRRVADLAHPPADLQGAVVFNPNGPASQAQRRALYRAGAVAILEPASATLAQNFAAMTELWRRDTVADLPAEPGDASGPNIVVGPDIAAALGAAPDGAVVTLTAAFGAPELSSTQNLIAVIHGSAPDADRRAVLLSAHYDHLGRRNGELYPGANDDASGTAAVLEFARLIKAEATPRRTVYFALFGCEESGELGASYFRVHPVMPLSDLAANLEFEMIGQPDPAHPDTMMLTGWERSNLGPTLVAHGAHLGPDFYPAQRFFERSDNYQLARKGVVAQTISGWAVTPTYHKPTDDMQHVDIGFMSGVIQSMVEPVRWLLDSDFTPEWLPGQKP